MPINNLSETVRLPRLGKIHLGVRHPEKGYPMKTEYFVLPTDHPDYSKLVKQFGDKPKELRILVPVEDEEQWATQYYKAYSQTYGLICKGDGETAMRMADTRNGGMPCKTTETCAMRELACAGRECPEYKNKKCHEVMNLRFMLPDVPGLGVWQVDTGSINSILNINSCAKVIKKAFGRIAMIPLKLTLEPTPVNNPETGKKQTVYVMHLRTEATLAELAAAAREQAKTFMIEGPDLEAAYQLESEKVVELWDGQEVVETPLPQPSTKEQATELAKVMEMYAFAPADVRAFVNERGWEARVIGDLTSDQITETIGYFKDKGEGKAEVVEPEPEQLPF